MNLSLRDLVPSVPPNMALQRTRRPRIRSGRSLRSLGSPLNAQPLCVGKFDQRGRRSHRSGRPTCFAVAPSSPGRGRIIIVAIGPASRRLGQGKVLGGHEFAAA